MVILAPTNGQRTLLPQDPRTPWQILAPTLPFHQQTTASPDLRAFLLARAAADAAAKAAAAAMNSAQPPSKAIIPIVPPPAITRPGPLPPLMPLPRPPLRPGTLAFSGGGTVMAILAGVALLSALRGR